MRSLLWKEWREQRWKLAFGCAILMGFTAIGLRARLIPDEAMGMMTVLVGALALPVFAAMGLVAAERDEGTLSTLLSLPVRPWRVLAVKTAVGWLACAGPLVGAAVLSLVMASGREEAALWFVRTYAAGIGAASCVFLWTLALGIRQRGEARAAMIGMAIVGLCVVALVLASFLSAGVRHWAIAITPLAFFWLAPTASGSLGNSAPMVAVVQILLTATLCAVAASVFAKPGRTGS
jgi:ABC-type transport system involved in multi-copper enzyme maturation permease subunit